MIETAEVPRSAAPKAGRPFAQQIEVGHTAAIRAALRRILSPQKIAASDALGQPGSCGSIKVDWPHRVMGSGPPERVQPGAACYRGRVCPSGC